MTEEVLYTGKLRSEDLLLLIADCGIQKSYNTFFLAENLPTQVVDTKERQKLLLFSFFSPELPFADYTSGRIFHADWELRWEHREGNAHIVYLGQQSETVKWAMTQHRMQLKGQDNPVEYEGQPKLINLQVLSKQDHGYYLFGKRLDDSDVKQIGEPARIGDFAELRIHRILRYPAPGSMSTERQGRVKLMVREYLDPASGQVQFFRFQDLKEAIEDKECAG